MTGPVKLWLAGPITAIAPDRTVLAENLNGDSLALSANRSRSVWTYALFADAAAFWRFDRPDYLFVCDATAFCSRRVRRVTGLSLHAPIADADPPHMSATRMMKRFERAENGRKRARSTLCMQTLIRRIGWPSSVADGCCAESEAARNAEGALLRDAVADDESR